VPAALLNMAFQLPFDRKYAFTHLHPSLSVSYPRLISPLVADSDKQASRYSGCSTGSGCELSRDLYISTPSNLLTFSNTHSVLVLESLITILTPRLLPFFILSMIGAFPPFSSPTYAHVHLTLIGKYKHTANVSVCFLPIPVLPRIFHYIRLCNTVL
jgi:hypothetical protein